MPVEIKIIYDRIFLPHFVWLVLVLPNSMNLQCHCPGDKESRHLVASWRLTVICHGAYRAPDSKVHGANMGPIWGRQDPGGSHVDPMSLAIWGSTDSSPHLTPGAGVELYQEGRHSFKLTNKMTWYERQAVYNHRKYDCLLNILFRRRTNETSKLLITVPVKWEVMKSIWRRFVNETTSQVHDWS